MTRCCTLVLFCVKFGGFITTVYVKRWVVEFGDFSGSAFLIKIGTCAGFQLYTSYFKGNKSVVFLTGAARSHSQCLHGRG